MLYNPIKFPDFKEGWVNALNALKKNLQSLKDSDMKARLEGTLLYRYFKVPTENGFAFYQVTRVGKRTAHITLCEGLTLEFNVDPNFGEFASLPVAQVANFVKRREILDKL